MQTYSITGNAQNVGKDQPTVTSHHGYQQPAESTLMQSQPDYLEPLPAGTLVKVSAQ